MSNLFKSRTSKFNTVSAVLMLLLLLLQFMPFWKNGSMAVSIQKYIWYPTECTEVTQYLTNSLGSGYSINQIIGMPILTLAAAVVGVVLCVMFSDSMFVALLPIVCGVVGIWGYGTHAAFQLGSNWTLHLAVSVAIFAVGAVTLVSELTGLGRKN